MKLDHQQKKVVKKICEKYSLTEKQVTDIIESPFIFIRNKIKGINLTGEESQKEFQQKTFNFNIPRIGKLYANYYNFKRLNNDKRFRQNQQKTKS